MDEVRINQLIANNEENIFVDFKRDFNLYSKETRKRDSEKSAEFVKDCLGFLNSKASGPKYLIFGIDEKDGVVGVNHEDIELFKEERMQEYLNNRIKPKPIINFITNFMYQDKNLVVVEISSSNTPELYTLGKQIEFGNTVYQEGESFLRTGTQVKKLTALDALKFTDASLLSLIDSSLIDLKKSEEILDFVSFVDKNILYTSKLLDFLNININTLRVFNNSFSNYVLKGNIQAIKPVSEIDGGDKSIIESIFYISSVIYKLSKNFELKNFNTELTFIFQKDKESSLNRGEFLKITEDVEIINSLLRRFIDLQYRFSNIFFFKVTEVKFDDLILNNFGSSDLKFEVSDNILELFMEPLYASTDSFLVTIREILQNSYDACKDREDGIIKVDFNYSGGKLTNITIIDNGVGMNWDDISDYYLKVGNSSKSSSDGLIGKFGVGSLSLFMISDNCEISTKKTGEEECNFSIQREDFVVKRLFKSATNKVDESFTKLSLEVKGEYTGYTRDAVKRLLQIDEFILSSNLNLKFSFNEDGNLKDEIQAINLLQDSENNALFNLFEFDNAKVYILKNDDPSNLTSKIWQKLSKMSDKLLYNNQLGNVIFDSDSSIYRTKNIVLKNFPLIVVVGKISSENGYITELSREKYTIKGNFLEKIIDEEYKNKVPKLKKELKYINRLDCAISEKLEKFDDVLHSMNLKVDNVVFNEAGILEDFVNGSKYVRKIYTNELPASQFTELIQDAEFFTQERMNSDKSAVANRIEGGVPILISENLLERYVINARGSNSGFRAETLKKILNSIDYDFSEQDSVNKLWDLINHDDEIIKYKISQKSKNRLTYLNEDGERIVSRTDKEYISNILVVDTSISRQFDDSFLEYYNN